jgi:hypothetical protein
MLEYVKEIMFGLLVVGGMGAVGVFVYVMFVEFPGWYILGPILAIVALRELGRYLIEQNKEIW